MNANATLNDTAAPVVAPTPSLKTANQSRLALWLKKLPAYQLPLNPALAEAIRSEMREQECTSDGLAALIQQDPALTLALYQSASSRMQSKEGDIQGLVHLIGLIGLGVIEDILKPINKSLQLEQGQAECFAASLFAADLCRRLLPIRHGTVGERFFLPSLLYSTPLWMMWQAAPKVMGKIHLAAGEQKQNLNTVCKAKLGFNITSLFKHSTDLLQLQDMSRKALSIDMSQDLVLWAKLLQMKKSRLKLWLEDNLKEKHFFLSQGTGVFLVNQYALALYQDHHGKHIYRFENLLCKYLGVEIKALKQHVSHVALSCKIPSVYGDNCKPQYRLRGLHRGQDIHFEKHNYSETTESGSVLQRLEEASTVSQALDLSYRAMLELTSANHLLVFRKGQHTDDALKLYFQHGLKDEAIESLTLKNNLCGAFFKKIQEKPIALWIDKDKIQKIEKQLPKPLLRFWQPQPFSIMSVFHGGEPHAIIICDKNSWGMSNHAEFKNIGKTLTKVLKRL